MFFQRIFTQGLSVNSYLLGDEKTKECVAIDPTRYVVPYIVQAQNAGMDIIAILETHVHADFVSGSKELKHQLNGKPFIYASGMGGEKWIPSYTDKIVYQGTQIKLGEIRLQAIHAPGHTPEHLIWVCYDESLSSDTPMFSFTGDCLLVGSVGRPDLLGDNHIHLLTAQLYHTLFEVLLTLPDFLEILPSHSKGSLCGKSIKLRANSTLGYERRFNPYLRNQSKEKWILEIEKDTLPTPPYFKYVKQMNLSGPPLVSSLKTAQWFEEEDKPNLSELFLVDIRHPEPFANSHFKGSINIPLTHTFSQWVGWMLPQHLPIGLIVENTRIFSEVVDQLRLMGFDQEIWVIPFDLNKYDQSFSIVSFKMIDVEELAKRHSSNSFYIVDVRSLEEWNTGHISSAYHLELNYLEMRMQQLPMESTIALVCRSGQRASLAASILEKHGFKSVMNVRGGMQAWKQAGLPLVL